MLVTLQMATKTALCAVGTKRTRDDIQSHKTDLLCEPVRELFCIRCMNVSFIKAVNYRCYIYSICNLNKSLRGVFLS
jgi:hypothetical protein